MLLPYILPIAQNCLTTTTTTTTTTKNNNKATIQTNCYQKLKGSSLVTSLASTIRSNLPHCFPLHHPCCCPWKVSFNFKVGWYMLNITMFNMLNNLNFEVGWYMLNFTMLNMPNSQFDHAQYAQLIWIYVPTNTATTKITKKQQYKKSNSPSSLWPFKDCSLNFKVGSHPQIFAQY